MIGRVMYGKMETDLVNRRVDVACMGAATRRVFDYPGYRFAHPGYVVALSGVRYAIVRS
jgi:hypothetical protein